MKVWGKLYLWARSAKKGEVQPETMQKTHWIENEKRFFAHVYWSEDKFWFSISVIYRKSVSYFFSCFPEGACVKVSSSYPLVSF